MAQLSAAMPAADQVGCLYTYLKSKAVELSKSVNSHSSLLLDLSQSQDIVPLQ